MSVEVAVVIAKNGEPIYWHLPPGRAADRIPDTRSLHEVLVQHKDDIKGVAHSHPGSGVPGPSYEDVTTFAAIEGNSWRLDWWITTETHLVVCRWVGPDRLSYGKQPIADLPWVHELRRLSYSSPT